jgi:hypothetical protein
MIGCATGLGVVAAALARSRRQHTVQFGPIATLPAEPAPPAPPVAVAISQPRPIRPVLVHAPDPLAEPVARLEAEMALSAVIVTAELRAPRPAAAAVLDRPPPPLPDPPVTVATVFPVEVEPPLRLDEFVEVPTVVEAAPAAASPIRRRVAAWLLGAVAAVAVVLCIVLFVVGTQAPGAATRYPMHNVVGMRADEARTLLARDDVRLLTVQADHGPAGVVLKESGFDADGTYGPGSQIVLLVGGGN